MAFFIGLAAMIIYATFVMSFWLGVFSLCILALGFWFSRYLRRKEYEEVARLLKERHEE